MTCLWVVCSIYLSSLQIVNSQPVNHPGPRWGHVFVYDPVRDNVLLFGGAPQRGNYLDDTWIWDKNTWKKMEVIGPSPRGFCAATFHQNRKSVIIHGGRGENGTVFTESWEWDGRKWTNLGESEYKADHHQMVYLPRDNKLLAFGGWNGSGVNGDTWLWDGTWVKMSIQSPPPRASFGMTYNPDQNSIQLFGGLWINGQYADSWQWKENKWEQLGGHYDNSSLDHHAMVYDEKSQRTIIFGGKNYRYKPRNRTLLITGGSVEELEVDGPSERHSIGLTYDSSNNFIYLYGGKEYQGEQQVALGDMWLFNGNEWRPIENQ